MKKLTSFALLLVVVGFVGWQKRVDILVFAAPKLQEFFRPVADHRPIEWSRGPETASLGPNERSPNIVLIVTDDMGFNDISFYNGGAGDGSLQTPNIDALAEQGVTFTNGYAANAVCSPSRASISVAIKISPSHVPSTSKRTPLAIVKALGFLTALDASIGTPAISKLESST